MRRRLLQGMAVVGYAVVLSAGCGEATIDNPIDPTTPQSTIETFSGVVTVNGAVTFPFTSSGGSINATLSDLKPDGSTVGMLIGSSSGATCQVQLSNDNAGINSVILGVVRDGGTLCARI